MAVKNYGIHDQWTNLDTLNSVDIKSVDGVIESVKINGEEAGGGSSDFSTAVVTIIDGRTPTSGTTMAFQVSNLVTYNDEDGVTAVNGLRTFPEDSFSFNTILYKGKAISYISFEGISQMPTLSGNITFSQEYEGFIITGDCTITIS